MGMSPQIMANASKMQNSKNNLEVFTKQQQYMDKVSV